MTGPRGEPAAFTVVQSTLAMAPALEAIQRASFPTLAADELITAAHYRAHIERFPEGQLAVVTAERQLVACSTDFRTTFDFGHIEHRYIDAVDHNWLGRHDPDGDWLYGADVGVLPGYRRRGLARRLYEARHALVRRLRLRGHVAGGLLRGYGAWKARMAVDEYVARVVAGELVGSDAHRAAPMRLRGARDHPELRHRPFVRQQGGPDRLAESRVLRRVRRPLR